jgi:pimeloyl-ACP methyl ester carboxylesterase
MPNLTSKILPGAGHGSIIEKPEAISQLMTAFFNKTAS